MKSNENENITVLPTVKCSYCGKIASDHDKTAYGVQTYICNHSECKINIFTFESSLKGKLPQKVVNRYLKILLIFGVAGLVWFAGHRIINRGIIDDTPEPLISMDKFRFAENKNFRFRMVHDEYERTCSFSVRRYTDPRSSYFDPFYIDLVFVHSEEDAIGFPDNVIVAWPCEWISTRHIDSLNRELRRAPYEICRGLTRFPSRDIVYVEDYGLTYPITASDLADYWMNVKLLRRSLVSNIRGFRVPGEESLRMWDNERHVDNEQTEQQALIPYAQFLFAQDMRFIFRIMVDGERRISITGSKVVTVIRPDLPSFDPFYTDLIFVYNEEKAIDFPDNVIVAWPSDDYWTENVVGLISHVANLDEDGIPWDRTDATQRDVLNIEDFGLTYPITITDLLNNWENVNALWQSFTFWEQHGIQGWMWYQWTAERLREVID